MSVDNYMIDRALGREDGYIVFVFYGILLRGFCNIFYLLFYDNNDVFKI